MFVSVSFTTTDTPIWDVIVSEIFLRVTSDILVYNRISDNLFFSTSVKTLFEAATNNLALDSSLSIRSFLKKANVFSLCLKPKEEPAIFNKLYSGLSKSK